MNTFEVETESYYWTSKAPHHHHFDHPVRVEIADDNLSIRIAGEFRGLGNGELFKFDFTFNVDKDGNNNRVEIIEGRANGRDTYCTTIAKITDKKVSLWGDNGRLQHFTMKEFIEKNRYGYRLDIGGIHKFVQAEKVSE